METELWRTFLTVPIASNFTVCNTTRLLSATHAPRIAPLCLCSRMATALRGPTTERFPASQTAWTPDEAPATVMTRWAASRPAQPPARRPIPPGDYPGLTTVTATAPRPAFGQEDAAHPLPLISPPVQTT